VQDPGESFTVHGGGNPSPCTVEASARSWRIIHRARWRQVQDPGPCTVEASLESWTLHGGGQFRILDRARWRPVYSACRTPV